MRIAGAWHALGLLLFEGLLLALEALEFLFELLPLSLGSLELLDREPLTGVHRIRFETLVQTYESRLREQRVTPPAAPNPATADASSP